MQFLKQEIAFFDSVMYNKCNDETMQGKDNVLR